MDDVMMERKCIFFKMVLSILQFSLLIIELLVVHGSLLVLLVLGHKIVHVGLSLGELHLVHALAWIMNVEKEQMKNISPDLCTNARKPSS